MALTPLGGRDSAHPRTAPIFLPLLAKRGEGREEADYSSSNPLAPALSPLGRGEEVGAVCRWARRDLDFSFSFLADHPDLRRWIGGGAKEQPAFLSRIK